MKKFSFILLAIVAFIGFTSETLFHSGSPGGKTGSPGDGSSCTQCHNGAAQNESGWITSTIPVTGYTPGQTYTVTLAGTAAGAGLFGFEITCEDGSNAKVGTYTLTNSTTTQLVGSNGVTHTAGGIAPVGGGFSWSFDWTAPAAGTGSVTFYASVNAADGTGGNGGDVIYLTNLEVTEEIITGIEENQDGSISIYPNPASEVLNIDLLDRADKVEVYNSTGQLVNQSLEKALNYSLNISDLPAGYYFVKVSGETMNINEMILVK